MTNEIKNGKVLKIYLNNKNDIIHTSPSFMAYSNGEQVFKSEIKFNENSKEEEFSSIFPYKIFVLFKNLNLILTDFSTI